MIENSSFQCDLYVRVCWSSFQNMCIFSTFWIFCISIPPIQSIIHWKRKNREREKKKTIYNKEMKNVISCDSIYYYILISNIYSIFARNTIIILSKMPRQNKLMLPFYSCSFPFPSVCSIVRSQEWITFFFASSAFSARGYSLWLSQIGSVVFFFKNWIKITDFMASFCGKFK